MEHSHTVKSLDRARLILASTILDSFKGAGKDHSRELLLLL